MVQESFVLVHRRSWHLWWPVEQRLVPLRKTLLGFIVAGLALERDVLVVVGHLVEGRAPIDRSRNRVARLLLVQPLLEVLVVIEGRVIRSDRRLRHVLLGREGALGRPAHHRSHPVL